MNARNRLGGCPVATVSTRCVICVSWKEHVMCPKNTHTLLTSSIDKNHQLLFKLNFDKSTFLGIEQTFNTFGHLVFPSQSNTFTGGSN